MRIQRQKITHWIQYASLVLIILVALIAVTVWTDSRQTILTFDANVDWKANVKSIRIQRPGVSDINMHLVDKQWRMSEPCNLAVNNQRLQPLLVAMAPSAQSYAANEVDLDAAGLLTPQAVIIFNDTRIEIGTTDLSGERRYIKRSSRIEFVPDWILSLINGGTTALAELSVFPDTLNAVSLSQDNDSEKKILPAEQLEIWQSLTAQQIVLWPIEDVPPLIDTFKVDLESTDQKGTDQQQNIMLHRYSSYSALVFEQAKCAYIVANDAIPVTADH